MNTCPLRQTGSPDNNAWSWPSPHRIGKVVCAAHLQGATLHCLQPGWYTQGHTPCADIWNAALGLQQSNLNGRSQEGVSSSLEDCQVNNEKPHRRDQPSDMRSAGCLLGLRFQTGVPWSQIPCPSFWHGEGRDKMLHIT